MLPENLIAPPLRHWPGVWKRMMAAAQISLLLERRPKSVDIDPVGPLLLAAWEAEVLFWAEEATLNATAEFFQYEN